MQDFKKLRVWQKSYELTLEIYRATKTFPDTERFGLVQQLREAAVSVASNLAEGSSRRGDIEFRRFVGMALGSASEMECQLLIARDLGWLSRELHDQLNQRVESVRQMMCSLNRRLSFAAEKPGRARAAGSREQREAGGR